mgnify:CR=1 FL=1
MKVTRRIEEPYPAITIEDFTPPPMVRAAAESYDLVDDWVKYGGDEAGQIQYCSKLGRENIPPAALTVLDYISTYFDPNIVMGLTDNAFPDMSHYGGGMMLTPNKNGEGGHGIHRDWKREYSAILCLSEEYDSSFDLKIHNGKDKHTTIPYKFNQLNVFKCSDNSWHGLPEITKGMDRKTLGVMYWSKDKKGDQTKAKFNNNLEFS